MTPLWNKRFQDYRASFMNHNHYKIEFCDDDNLENFYEEFGYEPDEQPPVIKNMALKRIEKISHNRLYRYLFGNNLTINIPDKYTYKLINETI